MARITVEDCIDKVEGPYDLVLIAKERTAQLNSGEKPNVDPENVDIVIPGNDDAIRSIELIASSIADSCLKGLGKRKEVSDKEETK